MIGQVDGIIAARATRHLDQLPRQPARAESESAQFLVENGCHGIEAGTVEAAGIHVGNALEQGKHFLFPLVEPDNHFLLFSIDRRLDGFLRERHDTAISSRRMKENRKVSVIG